jgi:hypothetical protein
MRRFVLEASKVSEVKSEGALVGYNALYIFASRARILIQCLGVI